MADDPDRAIYQDLNTLSEPIRVRLLRLLEAEELGVGELVRVTQLPQSTVSRHLKTLLTQGWVQRRSDGPANLFRLRAGADSDSARSRAASAIASKNRTLGCTIASFAS